jgi:diguanylate cyclase (GGDEF)-like protein
MSIASSSNSNHLGGQAFFPLAHANGKRKFGFISGARGTLIAVGGLVLTFIIALFDYGTGPYLSFGIFYLIPVALCAWWSGFAHGIIVALGGAVAWHIVDAIENPMIPDVAGIWNGIVRFGTLVLTSSLVARLHEAVLREHVLARTDPLTGAANGRTFYETVQVECERARRASRYVSLAYFDVDNFKFVNDKFGHATGDAVLLQVVSSIHLHLRNSDLLARLGGDEFALLMPETASDGAVTLLARLQAAIARDMTSRGWPVTLSVGAITLRSMMEDVDQMIQRVDTLMYKAKKKGKGQLEHEFLEVDTIQSRSQKELRSEKRGTVRVLCHREVRVRKEKQENGPSQFAIIRNISAQGMCVCLESDFIIGSLLVIESLSSGKAPLLARVRNVKRIDNGWNHGCELATKLNHDDLSFWIDATSVLTQEI